MTADLKNSRGPEASRVANRREILIFGLALAGLLLGFFHESLIGGKILSPADVLLVQAGFQEQVGPDYEPANRLLMDPVLQFQPWLEFNRSEIRQGRLPLWNPLAGCGAPHLANGQSAVFDPFNVIAYVWTVPDALGWMAAARLWTAGMGMFLLARAWKLGRWGCCFSGLVFPFSGFLVGWLLYPVTPVAIWMPWMFLVSHRALNKPDGYSVVLVALVTALVIFGGHIQTGAHVLTAVGLYVLIQSITAFRARQDGRPYRPRGLLIWGAGLTLGLALAAVQILPLADYLSKSPVWGDRQRDTPPWWKPSKPRVLDILCTPLPYIFGSQRRGQPNLARALGVHNLNESSGGFVGLPTLVLLVPLAWRSRRIKRDSMSEDPEIAPYLIGLAIVGFLGAYRFPPVDNLLRLIPVLNVTDNRRLGLWMAFALSLLGGIGLDGFRGGMTLGKRWSSLVIFGTLALLLASTVVLASKSAIQKRAEAHYRQAADRNSESDPAAYLRRADRRAQDTVRFLPRYYAESACLLAALVGLMAVARRRPDANFLLCSIIFLLTLGDLWRFGGGLNPAIDRSTQSYEPSVITSLREILKPGERMLGVGEDFPPNVAMRFGLGDPRNYDSIELARNLSWFAPLYGAENAPGEASTSRRTIDWRGVARARERLEAAGVRVVIGSAEPPAALFENVEKHGRLWITRLNSRPWITWESVDTLTDFSREPGRIRVLSDQPHDGTLMIRELWDEGWIARIDGDGAPAFPHRGTFLEVHIPSGSHTVTLDYDPPAVGRGLAISTLAAAMMLAILGLTRIRRYLIPGWCSSNGLDGARPTG